jgi:RNA polymerase sigma-70 factor (ECF subfamily)
MGNETTTRAEWMHSVLERYESRLLHYAWSITGERESARDAVQDTFLRLCRENSAPLESYLSQWLYTVCRNRALDIRRKESRMTTMDLEQQARHPEPGRSPDEQAARKGDHDAVFAQLEQLPSNQKEVLILKFQQGLSYKEISGVTKLSISNVGFLIHTALKTLRQDLNPQNT